MYPGYVIGSQIGTLHNQDVVIGRRRVWVIHKR